MLQPASRVVGHMFWRVLVHLVESALFVLLGLQIRRVMRGISGHSWAQLLIGVAVVTAVIIAVRMAWALWAFPLGRHLPGRHLEVDHLGWGERVAIGWSGTRGGPLPAAVRGPPPAGPCRTGRRRGSRGAGGRSHRAPARPSPGAAAEAGSALPQGEGQRRRGAGRAPAARPGRPGSAPRRRLIPVWNSRGGTFTAAADRQIHGVDHRRRAIARVSATGLLISRYSGDVRVGGPLSVSPGDRRILPGSSAKLCDRG